MTPRSTYRTQGSALLTTLVVAFVLSTTLLGMGLSVTSQYRLARATSERQEAHNAMESMAESTLAYLLPRINADGTMPTAALPESRAPVITDGPHREAHCDVEYTSHLEHLAIGVLEVQREETCPEGMSGVQNIAYVLSSDFTEIVDVLAVTDSTNDPHPAFDTDTISIGDPDDENDGIEVYGSGSNALVRVRVNIEPQPTQGYLRMIVEGPSQSILQRQIAVENRPVPPGRTSAELGFEDWFTMTSEDQIANPEGLRRVKVLFSPEPFDEASNGRIRWDGCSSPPCGAASIAWSDYPAGTYDGFHDYGYASTSD